MIGWLVQTSLYVPLTFETGMTSGALSIFLSRIGYKFYKSCLSSTDNGTPTTMNRYVYKITKNIVNPINTIENLLNDPNYSETIRLLFFCLGLLLVVCIFNFILYRKMKKASQEALLGENIEAENQNGIFNKKSQNGQQNWKNEAQRLLEERKDFVKKVEQVEGLNRRYREAIFQIEKSYNEEHKLKKIEQKRLKNLTKFMEQCSVIVANRKDKLDDTLSRAVWES